MACKEEEAKLEKPIQGLKHLHGHDWLIDETSTLFLSINLLSFAIFYLYSLFLNFHQKDCILKKIKMTERTTLKGALSLVQTNT